MWLEKWVNFVPLNLARKKNMFFTLFPLSSSSFEAKVSSGLVRERIKLQCFQNFRSGINTCLVPIPIWALKFRKIEQKWKVSIPSMRYEYLTLVSLPFYSLMFWKIKEKLLKCRYPSQGIDTSKNFQILHLVPTSFRSIIEPHKFTS